MPRPQDSSSARLDQRLVELLGLLTDHATVVVSGAKVAREMGASRSAVWRMVERLRALGVEIAGHSTTGYSLLKIPDLLLPDALDPLLKKTIFAGKIHHSFQVASTNTQAMQAAAEGAPEGTLFVAEEQTAGRGRGGHSWHSEKSFGIYCTVILRPQLPPADALALSLAAGLAVQAAVKQVTGLGADLRWPNDLLLSGKKFCGILIEMNAEITRVRYAAVGIGMNVNQQKFPAELRARATSLILQRPEGSASSSRTPWSRVELLAALLQSLDREYRELSSVAAVIRRFEERSSYARDKRVRVEEDGEYEGVTEGLDDRGFLRVRTSVGVRTVISGGVRALEGD
jgi:BirA family transcriptional regulator, biotin operon repressor / biotin---[acetyl-CoA-carboxylase] ligase